ncbi:MAG: nitrilase-related carbon-nitrogen hydrolase, partial [Mangrovicoccus sp.]
MSDKFRLTLAQLNPTVGALAENAALAKTAWDAARERGSDMLALTEMFITGYQVQDLIRRRSFVRAAMAQIESLAASCIDGPALAIGGPWLDEQDRLFNAYYICQGGQITARVLKHRLPNNDVFDEVRHYTPGDITGPYVVGPIRIGSPICEDAWTPDVAEALAESGAEILLIPNGSPYHRGKQDERIQLMVNRVVETGLPLVYLNMVGGQDDQVFD